MIQNIYDEKPAKCGSLIYKNRKNIRLEDREERKIGNICILMEKRQKKDKHTHTKQTEVLPEKKWYK